MAMVETFSCCLWDQMDCTVGTCVGIACLKCLEAVEAGGEALSSANDILLCPSPCKHRPKCAVWKRRWICASC